MKIIDIRESTRPIQSDIRNAYIDFSRMNLSLVAVVTKAFANSVATRAADPKGASKCMPGDRSITSRSGNRQAGRSTRTMRRFIRALARATKRRWESPG